MTCAGRGRARLPQRLRVGGRRVRQRDRTQHFDVSRHVGRPRRAGRRAPSARPLPFQGALRRHAHVCCSVAPRPTANRDNLETDLVLDGRIEELELEEESCHIAAELVQYVPLAGDASDDEKAKSWTLPSVPAALKAELDAYTLHRTEPLNRQRDGSCVVDLTVGGDKAT